MPRPIPTPLRRALYRRWRRGQAARTIAEALGLALRTVRRLLRRCDPGEPESVLPAYARRGPQPARADTPLRSAALQLRRQHPTWGAPLIRVLLGHDFPATALPTARTLQRWFHDHGLGPAPKGRRPQPNPDRAAHPHDVWQMDAAEQVRLGNGRRVSWLRIVDEHTGAVLATRVFPPRPLGQGRRPRRAGGRAADLPALGASPGLPRR